MAIAVLEFSAEEACKVADPVVMQPRLTNPDGGRVIGMGGAVGYFVAVAIVVMRSCKQLAGFDKHFADMLVAVHNSCDGRQVVEIEDVHMQYLSKIKNTSGLVT